MIKTELRILKVHLERGVEREREGERAREREGRRGGRVIAS